MSTRSATWTFGILAFWSNLLFMAGLASLQYACNAGFIGPVLRQLRVPAAFGMSDTFAKCSTVSRFYWFAWAFLTVTLIGLAIAASSHTALHYSRGFWVGMITVNLFTMTVACEAFLGYEFLYEDAVYFWLSRFRATVAGAIINVVWLVGLLMAVGIDWERTGGYNDGVREGVLPK